MRTRIFPLMLCLLTLALCAPAEAGPIRATAKGLRAVGRVVTAPVRFVFGHRHGKERGGGCDSCGCN